MLSLELHSSHQQKPKQAVLSVIAAGEQLVIDKGHVWLLSISFFPLVVADKYDCSVKPGNEFSNDPAKQVPRPHNKTDVIQNNTRNVDLHRANFT